MRKRKRARSTTPVPDNELEEFRNFLGSLALDYTDSELRQLRREMVAMAEMLLDLYLSKKKQAVTEIKF